MSDKPIDENSGNVIHFESVKVKAISTKSKISECSPPLPPPAPVPPANLLLDLVLANADLFTDEYGEPQAAIRSGIQRGNIYSVNSRAFCAWLDHLHFVAYGAVPRTTNRRDALSAAEGLARFDRPTQSVHIRVAAYDGCIYLDLANDLRQVVRVSSDGWRVQDVSPVRFRRPKGMLALPVPERGGSVSELRPFVNVSSDHAFYLLVGWLVGGLRPDGPYPVLALVGEQGSAKSTTAKAGRKTIDNNKAPLRSLPRSERDLAVSATNSWVMSFDNLSGLTPQQSDWVCRLATGGGFSGRALYTDAEEAILSFKRPAILNGIDDIAVRGDLVERAIVLHIPPISRTARVDEAALWNAFAAAHPRILGALLEGVVAALANLERTHLRELPRMADFARWVVAAEPGLGWPTGTFMAAYMGNRLDADAEALERDAVASVLVKWPELARTGSWTGTAEPLFDALCSVANDREIRSPTWPRAANALGAQLRRIAPVLRSVGIEVVIGKRTGRERPITIIRAPGGPSSSSSSSPVASVTAMTVVSVPPAEPSYDDSLASRPTQPSSTEAVAPSPSSNGQGADSDVVVAVADRADVLTAADVVTDGLSGDAACAQRAEDLAAEDDDPASIFKRFSQRDSSP